jgi:hypothetical protein
MSSEREPDGFVVIHHPPEDGAPYGVGPFPPDERLAEQLGSKSSCGCRVEVLWIGFPTGIKMMIGIEISNVIEALDQIDAAAEKDRLN